MVSTTLMVYHRCWDICNHNDGNFQFPYTCICGNHHLGQINSSQFVWSWLDRSIGESEYTDALEEDVLRHFSIKNFSSNPQRLHMASHFLSLSTGPFYISPIPFILMSLSFWQTYQHLCARNATLETLGEWTTSVFIHVYRKIRFNFEM